MKSFFYKHSIVSALIISVAILSACKDDDVDGEKAFQKEVAKKEEAFAKAFESIFGKIDPNQSWDFSEIGTKGTRTNIGGIDWTNPETWYYVNPDFKTTWLDQYLPEQIDNEAAGKGIPFIFNVPNDGIKVDLFPIYQGLAVSYWDMHMVVKKDGQDPIDIKFWEKNQGLQIKRKLVTWNESNVFYLQSKKDDKYLQALELGGNVDKSIMVKTRPRPTEGGDAVSWSNQFFIVGKEAIVDANGKGKNCYIKFKYKSARPAKITMQFHENPGQYLSGATVFELNSSNDFVNGITEFNTSTEWQEFKHYFTSPDKRTDENGGEHMMKTLTFNLSEDADGNDFYFTDIEFSTDYGGTNLLNGNWENSQDSFKEQIYQSNVGAQPCKIIENFSMVERPVGLTSVDYTHAYAVKTTPYCDTQETGLRFTIVAVKYLENGNKVEKKVLLAFTDRPENGKFVSVDNGKVVFKGLDQIGNVKNCNSYGSYYDGYLMISNYLIRNNNGTLEATPFNGAGRPWDAYMNDRTINDASYGYKWNFITKYRYRYEQYMVGCNSDGVKASNVDDYSKEVIERKSIWSKYNNYNNGLGLEDWMSVRMDIDEQTRVADKGAAKPTICQGFHFEFPASLAGATISFYWETKTPFDRRYRSDNKGMRLRSEDRQMLVIKQAKPTNVLYTMNGDSPTTTAASFKFIDLIGCEAGIYKDSGDGYDGDYNDMVFLFAADKAPTYVEPDPKPEPDPVPTYVDTPKTIAKRYMVEDLGSTDDIDFNDMVVDVIETYTERQYYLSGNTYGSPEKINRSQKAYVRAIGGTLPFDFYIGGNKIFSKSDLGVTETGMYNTGCGEGSSSASDNKGIGTTGNDIDYNKTYGNSDGYTIPDLAWSPSANNVYFNVYTKRNQNVQDETINFVNISFPNNGEVPHILAFPITKAWRNERRLCCWDWIHDVEPALWIQPENKPSDGTNGTTHTISFAEWYGNNGTQYLQWVFDYFGQNAQSAMDSWVKSKGSYLNSGN